jgi:uncharacterized protein YfaP (DUF2135 family)
MNAIARNCASLLLALAAARPAPAQKLDAPVGGWNVAGLVDKSDQMQVGYPYSLVDRGAQKGRTMIRGRLAAAGTQRPFPTLVVNGNPTPLYTDTEGRFARGYAFGKGSNSVEVRSASGKPLRRVQYYEASRTGPRPDLRVIAAWDDNQAEIDLHVITPDGQHAFWQAPFLSNGGGLDADSVDGPGPEMFTMTAPMHGTFQVWINYWGNFGSDGYHFDESTRQRPVITARVTLVYHENTPRERREDLVVPLRAIGELTLVKSFVY